MRSPWRRGPEPGFALPADVLAAGLLALAATAVLAVFYAGTMALRHQDTLFLVEGLQSILATGTPWTSTVSTSADAFKFFEVAPDVVCANPLRASGKPFNLLRLHGYLALYPMAALAAGIGVVAALALLNAAAHVALLLLPYVFLRRHRVPVLACVPLVLLVAFYPGWSMSTLGDLYLDRLAMPALLGLLFLLQARVDNAGGGSRAGIVVLALAASAMTERAAIMALGTLAYFAVMHRTALRADRRWMLLTAAVVLAWLVTWFGFFFEGVPGGGHVVKSSVLEAQVLAAKLHSPGLRTFALTNLLFLGWLALFAGWRPALLALGAMAPNLLITVGGAELAGWTTHYHAMYIPFLVYAATVGYQRLVSRPAVRWPPLAGFAAAGVSALLLQAYDPFSARWGWAPASPTRQVGVVSTAWQYFVHPDTSPERAVAFWAGRLQEAVPPGATVSAVERALPALHVQRQIAFWPIGLGSAQYLVVDGALRADGAVDWTGGAVHYGGPDARKRLDACLQQRATASGYHVTADIRGLGLLVLRRELGANP